MSLNLKRADDLAQRLALQYAELSPVEAVALGGSRTSAFADEDSDIDLYVYSAGEVPLEFRRSIASAERAEIGNQNWEPGDEWIDSESGTRVDVMFRRQAWIEEQLEHVLRDHQASVGYSTCFWYNVLHSRSLFDRNGWFARLQHRARVPYPKPLRVAIIEKNFRLLRNSQSSFLRQINLAIERVDVVSMNHRASALLASYFDVLFALNELPHPGEKRQIAFAEKSCRLLPQGFPDEIVAFLAALPERGHVDACAGRLIDRLEQLLAREGKLPRG